MYVFWHLNECCFPMPVRKMHPKLNLSKPTAPTGWVPEVFSGGSGQCGFQANAADPPVPAWFGRHPHGQEHDDQEGHPWPSGQQSQPWEVWYMCSMKKGIAQQKLNFLKAPEMMDNSHPGLNTVTNSVTKATNVRAWNCDWYGHPYHQKPQIGE